MQQAERHVVGGQHVEHAELGEIAGGDIAGMGLAAHDIGRAHQHAHASLVRSLGRLKAGRELGEFYAMTLGFFDMGKRRIIVACHRDAALGTDAGEGVTVDAGIPCRQRQPAFDEAAKASSERPRLVL